MESKILALGSPHGDDRIAWLVADHLQRDPRFARIAHQIRSPWDVLDHVTQGSRLIILDAIQSGTEVGTIVRIAGTFLELANGDFPVRYDSRSTHAGDLFETLRMARALGRECEEVVVLAIEIGPTSCEQEMTPALVSAAAEFEAEIRRTLLEGTVVD